MVVFLSSIKLMNKYVTNKLTTKIYNHEIEVLFKYTKNVHQMAIIENIKRTPETIKNYNLSFINLIKIENKL